MTLEEKAIARYRDASELAQSITGLPLVVCYSGGKDSEVLLHLAQRAGVPFEVLHGHTTADAPPTVYHIRKVFHRLECEGIKCTVEMPVYKGKPTTMWDLIPQKLMPPTRSVRYCCEVLKEHGGTGRMIATGVRWAESAARKKRGALEVTHRDPKKKLVLMNDNDEARRVFETCTMKGKRIVNPIIEWSTEAILDYCESYHLEMNPLYSQGFCRVGCVGCPIAGKSRKEEFRLFPTYKKAYIRAFDQMLEARRAKGLPTDWQTGQDVYHWWMEDGVMTGQLWLPGTEDV